MTKIRVQHENEYRRHVTIETFCGVLITGDSYRDAEGDWTEPDLDVLTLCCGNVVERSVHGLECVECLKDVPASVVGGSWSAVNAAVKLAECPSPEICSQTTVGDIRRMLMQ